MSLPTPPISSLTSSDVLKEGDEKIAKSNFLSLHVVVFTVNHQTYAIESRFIKEIFIIKELTSLFDMPPHFKGVVNLRRRIVAVFDFSVFLQLLPVKSNAASLAILLTNHLREFAMIVETVDRTETIPIESLFFYPPGTKQACLKGEFTGHWILIDGETLIQDPHLLIEERVNQPFAQENE